MRKMSTLVTALGVAVFISLIGTSAYANMAPQAFPSSEEFDEDTGGTIALQASDAEGDPLEYIIVQSTLSGSLSSSTANPTYIPNPDFNGSDSFTFKVNDGQLDSNTVTVSITVSPINDTPFAASGNFSGFEDGVIPVVLSGSDIDNDPLTFNLETQPSNGILTGTAPNLTYIPNPNYSGIDSFTFTVNDGQVSSNMGSIGITIDAVNDAPVADSQSLAVDEDLSLPMVLTGSDIENDPLAYLIQSNPSNGTLSGTAPNLVYTPNPDFNGSDSFTFKVNDGQLDSNTVIVSITVNDIVDDVVVITKASYSSGKQELTVEATSTSNGSATLTVEGFGTMTYKSNKNKYVMKVKNVANPGTVTVTSSEGGSDSATVSTKGKKR